MKPYTEKLLSENKRVRKFSCNVDPMLLEWHQDKNDRTIKVLEGKGWQFQLDESLPVDLNPGDLFKIPSFTWHRIIKGESDLVLKITESKFKKGDKVKWSGGKGVVKVPNAKGSLVGVDPEGSDKMDMVPEKELSLIKEQKKKKKLPAQYDAPPKSKRAKLLKKASELYKKGDIEGAAKIRKDMEAKHMDETLIREMISDITEEIKLDEILNEIEQKLQEKKGKSPKGLSKAIKKSLDKKADKRCLTRGSVYSEFRAGLAAFLSSGSRKGMSAHQWAHARVNSAQPSKKWAKVKKRKKCPKKK